MDMDMDMELELELESELETEMKWRRLQIAVRISHACFQLERSIASSAWDERNGVVEWPCKLC